MPRFEAYLSRFRAFGAAPSVERYLDLFHPEGTLFDSGMERPLTVAEIPAHISAILAVLKDFRFEVVRSRVRDDTVFAEAHNRASFGGAPFAWSSVYCMTLDGEHVRRGRRYYDRAPLLSKVSPDLPTAPRHTPAAEAVPEPVAGRGHARFVEDLGALWQAPHPLAFAAFYANDGALVAPGLPRAALRTEVPGYYRFLLSLIPDLRLQPVAWAGDAELVFVEWLGSGHVGGKPLSLPVVDRFCLADGLVTEGCAYFDSLPLAQALAAPR